MFKEVLARPEYAFLNEYDIMFLAPSGSYNYHLEVADSDYDMRGVLMPTMQDILNNEFEVKTHSFEGLDLTLYSFGQFLKLLKDQSAAITEMFMTDRLIICNHIGEYFYRNLKLFDNNNFLFSNLDFIEKQLTRITNMTNVNETTKRFNLFNMLENTMLEDNFYLVIEVTSMGGKPTEGMAITHRKYKSEASRVKGLNTLLFEDEITMSDVNGLTYNGTPITLGEAFINTVDDLQMSIGDVSGQLTIINHTYKNYLRTNSAFLNSRQKAGKMGKHIAQVYRVIIMLQHYMNTSEISYNMEQQREFLLGLKPLNDFEEITHFLSHYGMINNLEEHKDLPRMWQELLKSLRNDVKTYARAHKNKFTQKERLEYINGLVREIVAYTLYTNQDQISTMKRG